MARRFWFPTLLRSMARRVRRMLAPLAAGVVGAASAFALAETPAKAPYDEADAMAAYEHFWAVQVAVQAVAGDLASAPLQARTITQVAGDKARTQVVDPAIELLREPNPTTGGYLFRKQLATDWLLTGNAYIWRTETALWRLDPSDVDPIPGISGLVAGYRVRDSIHGTEDKTLSPSEVLHVRDVSVRHGKQAAYGHSPIRTLHEDLLTEYRTRELAREQATKGRPSVIISVKGGIGEEQAEDLAATYEEGRQKKRSAFVHGEDMDVTPINYTARDLEFIKRSALTTEAVLAVYEVPPARAGLATANYGTSRQQSRTYVESLIRRACLWNDAWSTLCRPGIEIIHDFSDSEALQVARTDQLKRVVLLTTIGATAAAAAAYEGLHDAPLPDERLDAAAPTTDSRRPDEPQDQRRTVVDGVSIGAIPKEPPLAAALTRALAASAAHWEAMAEGLEPGVSAALLRGFDAGRMFAALDDAGVPPAVSRVLADDHAATAATAVEILVDGGKAVEALTQREHWSVDRARRMAADIVRSLEEAA